MIYAEPETMGKNEGYHGKPKPVSKRNKQVLRTAKNYKKQTLAIKEETLNIASRTPKKKNKP